MKKWKSALIILSLIIGISVIFYFAPPKEIFKQLPLVKSLYKNTKLEVITPNGKAKVFIDGQDYGDTPVEVNNLVEGEYTVQLEKYSEVTDFYQPQTFRVDLTKNTTSRINIDIAPENFLEGSILYYTKENIKSKKGLLTITSNADNSKVYLDEEFLKSTPITNLELNPGEYNIEISAKDHTTVALPVVIREGYSLNIKAYLLPIPVNFDLISNE